MNENKYSEFITVSLKEVENVIFEKGQRFVDGVINRPRTIINTARIIIFENWNPSGDLWLEKCFCAKYACTLEGVWVGDNVSFSITVTKHMAPSFIFRDCKDFVLRARHFPKLPPGYLWCSEQARVADIQPENEDDPFFQFNLVLRSNPDAT